MEAEMRVRQLKSRDARIASLPQKQKSRKQPPLVQSGPANTLILNFQPLEQQEDISMLFKPSWLCYLVMSAMAN
jgi:hypothetical protein